MDRVLAIQCRKFEQSLIDHDCPIEALSNELPSTYQHAGVARPHTRGHAPAAYERMRATVGVCRRGAVSVTDQERRQQIEYDIALPLRFVERLRDIPLPAARLERERLERDRVRLRGERSPGSDATHPASAGKEQDG